MQELQSCPSQVSACSHAGLVHCPQVFVAGATGRTGARAVRELLKAGFKVRAGARDVKRAEEALEVAEAYGLLSSQQIKNVTIVPFDLSSGTRKRCVVGCASQADTQHTLRQILAASRPPLAALARSCAPSVRQRRRR